jgi:solute carrier family 25 protein 39/40
MEGQTMPAYLHGVAAAGGAIVTTMILNPLDVAKIRLQAHVCTVNCTGSKSVHLTGTLDTMLKVARHEGVLTLWRGLGPSLMLAIPSSGIYFTLYESIKQKLATTGQVSDSALPMFSGSSARTVKSVEGSVPFLIVVVNMLPSRIA